MLGLIYINVCGPITIHAMNGYTCFYHLWSYYIWSCVFDKSLNYLKDLNNLKIKLKYKIQNEKILRYFNWIDVVNTSTKIFKII